MGIIVENVPPGSRVIDSYPFSVGGTSIQAAALKADAVDGVVGYLGPMTKDRLEYVMRAGMGFMPVTTAGEYRDGALDEVAQLKKIGVPSGVCVWLDLEGIDAWNDPVAETDRLIREWCKPIADGGWIPALYVGAPQPFTGEQLFALPVKRYWLGQGRCVSKPNPADPCKCARCQGSRDAYPKRGWCMRQDWHGDAVKKGIVWRRSGVLVDTNGVQVDHLGGLPTWMINA